MLVYQRVNLLILGCHIGKAIKSVPGGQRSKWLGGWPASPSPCEAKGHVITNWLYDVIWPNGEYDI